MTIMMQHPSIMHTQTKEILKLPKIFSLEECVYLQQYANFSHHGDEEGHSYKNKNVCLTEVACAIWKHVKILKLMKGEPIEVDPLVKVYKLDAPKGEVSRHVDEDYSQLGFIAKYSIIIYLNDDYEGGETVFDTDNISPQHKTGEGLLFAHDILHEALSVKSGTKYVLKTDLFVNPGRV